MAQVTFTDGIASLWGAIDSVKDGQMNRRRLVVRRHDYGEDKNYDAELRAVWEEAYSEYRASLSSGAKFYHFYNYVYVMILRDMYEREKAG